MPKQLVKGIEEFRKQYLPASDRPLTTRFIVSAVWKDTHKIRNLVGPRLGATRM